MAWLTSHVLPTGSVSGERRLHQVRAAGQQAASVARWLDHSGQRHADAGGATRSTLSELGASTVNPARTDL